MKKISILFITYIFIISCTRDVPVSNVIIKKLYVVTTTSMIADAVRNIAGESIELESLMQSGVDPHLYKITASDASKLSRADIIFYNGLHLEGKMTEILEKLKYQKPVFAITDNIPNEQLRKIGEESGMFDPHIWFDVILWKLAVDKIEKALIQTDPKNQEIYQENGKVYQKKLEELHNWTKTRIASIPEKQRVLVTAHDAFGYFGRAYSMEVMGLQGVSTTAEYGVKDVEHLTDILVQRKITAIFVESSVSQKAIIAVIAGANARNHPIQLGGSLFSDSMGEAGTKEGTYIGMVEHNVRTIVEALQ